MSHYTTRHLRVNKLRGPATKQGCVDCGGPAKEWSQVAGSTGEDPMADYVARCGSCHSKYDRSNRREDQWIRKLTADDVRDIRVRIANGESMNVVAEDYGVSNTAIKKIKSGQNWSWLK